MSDYIKALIMGPGNMGKEYSKVLTAQKVEYDVLGRGEDSARNFTEQTGKTVIRDTVRNYMNAVQKRPTHAIVATRTRQLAEHTLELMESGVRNILVEKPAGISVEELERVVDMAKKTGTKIYVAYNRRFYASTNKALEIIEEDGGVSSFHFEFTEWTDKIVAARKEHRDELQELFIGNSCHVVDLAFFLGGGVKEMSAYIAGGFDWHRESSIFTGAGISNNGALFSYHANWNAPGRWSVEVLTEKHRLYFKPMEKLQIQEKNSLEVRYEEIEDSFDIQFKPGLYKEVESFLLDIDDGKKKTIEEQLEQFKIFKQIECGKVDI